MKLLNATRPADWGEFIDGRDASLLNLRPSATTNLLFSAYKVATRNSTSSRTRPFCHDGHDRPRVLIDRLSPSIETLNDGRDELHVASYASCEETSGGLSVISTQSCFGQILEPHLTAKV